MRVKIVYIDGVTEEVNNIPTEEVAAGIYAEACGNRRVLSAELFRGDGSHAAAYRFDDCTLELKTTEHIPEQCQQDGCGPEFCPGGPSCRGDMLRRLPLDSELKTTETIPDDVAK